MTDKSYTPRPVRVSKAPPPIVPISTKQNILPDLPPVPPPNWGKWAYMRDIELWEAAALSLNLEPDKLPVYLGAFDKFRDDPFRICPTPFLERLLVANSNCGISLGFKPVHELKARCLVDLPEFAAWAVNLNIPNLPPELVAMAEIISAVSTEPQATTPSPATDRVGSDDLAPMPAVANWKMDIQTEATAFCLMLRKSGANPTKRSILSPMAKWCRENNVMTDGKIFPSEGYLRTHVLGGKHWDVPN